MPLLDLIPSGATNANPCRFKVLRTWYQRVESGDVSQPLYLRYEVQNTGNIACSADVQMGIAGVDPSYSTKTVSAGATAPYADRRHFGHDDVPGRPEPGGDRCTIEITRQLVPPDRQLERHVHA